MINKSQMILLLQCGTSYKMCNKAGVDNMFITIFSV